MKAQHTPGPWSVEDPMGPEIISIVANTAASVYEWKHVAQLCGVPEDADDIPAMQAEANARLISAAPDLLEALKLADAALRGANMNMTVVERKVRDALAKAEGAP